MAIDIPARLAILGAGPIGLEAALYARFLGYDVVIYERGKIATRVRQSANKRMDTPFHEHRTTLGLAAIQAQNEHYRPPADDALLTGHEWLDTYLLPLSQTDLLADHFRLHTTVLNVENDESAVLETNEDEEGGGTPTFRVIARDETGADQADLFHGVLDCAGCRPSSPGYFALDATGYDQIRQAFAIIGDRESLDLYSSAARLLR